MRALCTDTRGAIMVLGLFMAVLLCGCLYYVMAIGDVIATRERLQDGVDAIALSSATLHARGMNVIALVNMTMAALLAVLIALKLISLVTKVAIAIIAGCSFLFGFCLPALQMVPTLTQISVEADQAHAQLQPSVHSALRMLRMAAIGVRTAVPFTTQARVATGILGHYSPPAYLGFAIPTAAHLPTKDGKYDELCERASGYVSDLVAAPLVIPGIKDIVAEAIKGLVDGAPGWFCGKGGAPPKTTVTMDRKRPLLALVAECERLSKLPGGKRDPAHQQVCDEATEQLRLSRYDDATGNCVEACGDDGPYAERVVLAREQCAPHAEGELQAFVWQAHTLRRHYVFHEGAWQIDGPDALDPPRVERGNKRPCGRESAEVSSAWNPPRATADGPFQPLCSNVAPPVDPGEEGQSIELAHTEVLQMLECTEIVEQPFEIKEGQGSLAASGSDAELMAPQELEDGLIMGEEPLQLRGLVVGQIPDHSLSEVMASIVKEPPLLIESAVARLGHIGIAQAEYFYDGEKLEDALWDMRWRARLRRFRLPDPETTTKAPSAPDASELVTDVGEACEKLMLNDPESSCESLDLSLNDLVAH